MHTVGMSRSRSIAWNELTGGQLFSETADPDPDRILHLTLPQRVYMGIHAERILSEHASQVLAPHGARMEGWNVIWPADKEDQLPSLLHGEMPGLIADLVGVDFDGLRRRWRSREEKAFLAVHPPDVRGTVFIWDPASRDNQRMQPLAMPGGRRDPQEWRELADGALHRAGWRRIEEWWSPEPRTVGAHVEPARPRDLP